MESGVGCFDILEQLMIFFNYW